MRGRSVRVLVGGVAHLTALLTTVLAISAASAGLGAASIRAEDLREWLSYIASDGLQGRALYSPGLGLAATYIEQHLRDWGVKPAGDPGSYRQTVRVLDVTSTSHSTLTIQVGGQSRTFADGQGITLPRNVGGKRRFSIDRVEFTGYGFDARAAGHADYAGKDVSGAAVVWLGNLGPRDLDQKVYRRVLDARTRYATDQLGAAASLGPEPDGASAPAAEFTTAQRLDRAIPPTVSASEAALEFLFSASPVKYPELRRRAAAQEALPAFRLEGVTLTFNLDADYHVVRTQLTENVVAVVEGTDPELKHTYVAFGAHYDHVGAAQGPGADGRVPPPPGRVSDDGALDDTVWNGADDDGSGTVAVMAIARAFAGGPRPRRSVLLVWHAGEESGLLGSTYFVDHPTVPVGEIVAQLNIDMVGRNRDNKASESNTVYLVGSDRISTELHQISQAANAVMPRPFTLDYELNSPDDIEQMYFRSDHFSYAAKGIPIIFFTTGLHPDYHANTDEVSRIEFDKLARVARMVYETGWRVANLDHAPLRDNRGPRAGNPFAPK